MRKRQISCLVRNNYNLDIFIKAVDISLESFGLIYVFFLIWEDHILELRILFYRLMKVEHYLLCQL